MGDGSQSCGAVLVKHQAGRKLTVILTLRVDDGLWFGTRSDPIYWRTTELINMQFDIIRL